MDIELEELVKTKDLSGSKLEKKLESGSFSNTIFTVLFIILLLVMSAVNIWLLLDFNKIEFTAQTKNSMAHKIIQAMFYILAIVPGIIAILYLIAFIYYMRSGAPSYLTIMYKLPLVNIIITLLIFSAIQFVISIFWFRLQPVNVNDQHYKDVSYNVSISGYVSLPLTILIVAIWGFYSYYNQNTFIKKLVAGLSEDQLKKILEHVENIKYEADLEDQKSFITQQLTKAKEKKNQSKQEVKNFVSKRQKASQIFTKAQKTEEEEE